MHSRYGRVFGDGWYDEGSTAVFTVENRVVDVSRGTRAVLTGWFSRDVDLSGLGVGATIRLTVNRPLEITVRWILQHLLTMTDQLDRLSEQSWVDEGQRVEREAPSFVEVGTGVRMIFKGWAGDISSNERKITFVMDGPKQLMVDWRGQYLLSVKGLDMTSAWHDAGSSVTLSAPQFKYVDRETRFRFNRWIGDISSESPTIIVSMDSPKTVEALWVKQFYVAVHANYKRAITVGSGWNDEGSTVEVKADQEVESGIFGIKYVFDGWDGDVFDHSSPSTKTLVDGVKTLVARYRPDYTMFLALVVLPTVAGGGGATAYFVRTRKKRRTTPLKEIGVPLLETSRYEKLVQLEQMFKEGVISAEAFEKLKEELMNEGELEKS